MRLVVFNMMASSSDSSLYECRVHITKGIMYFITWHSPLRPRPGMGVFVVCENKKPDELGVKPSRPPGQMIWLQVNTKPLAPIRGYRACRVHAVPQK